MVLFPFVLFAAALSSAPQAAPATPPTVAAPKAASSSGYALVDGPAPDAKALASAHRLVKVLDFASTIAKMRQPMIDQMYPMIAAQITKKIDVELDQPFADGLKALLADKFDHDFKRSIPRLETAAAVAYARHFTTAEIDQMVVLLDQPVMKRWRVEGPLIMTDIMPLLMEDVGEDDPEMKQGMTRLVEEFVARRKRAGAS